MCAFEPLFNAPCLDMSTHTQACIHIYCTAATVSTLLLTSLPLPQDALQQGQQQQKDGKGKGKQLQVKLEGQQGGVDEKK